MASVINNYDLNECVICLVITNDSLLFIHFTMIIFYLVQVKNITNVYV